MSCVLWSGNNNGKPHSFVAHDVPCEVHRMSSTVLVWNGKVLSWETPLVDSFGMKDRLI